MKITRKPTKVVLFRDLEAGQPFSFSNGTTGVWLKCANITTTFNTAHLGDGFLSCTAETAQVIPLSGGFVEETKMKTRLVNPERPKTFLQAKPGDLIEYMDEVWLVLRDKNANPNAVRITDGMVGLMFSTDIVRILEEEFVETGA